MSGFTHRQPPLWIGGYDLTNEGDWRWSSDNAPISRLRFFQDREPNGGTNENCLFLYSTGIYDSPCSPTYLALCETGAIGDVPMCSD